MTTAEKNSAATGWHVDPSDDFDQPRVLDWSGKVVAVLPEGSEHARLIAAAPDMAAALDRIFSYVSYVNIHGVGEQPEPREDGQPQPMRVPPEEFARIFKEIGTLASGVLSKAGS